MGLEPGKVRRRYKPRIRVPEYTDEQTASLRRECAWEAIRETFLPYFTDGMDYKPSAVALLRQLLEELEGRVCHSLKQ